MNANKLPLVVALKMSHRGCGVAAIGHHDGYPCARERPSLAITRARDVHEWGSTGEWWEGGDGVVCSDFHRVRHGCDSDLESGETDLL